ncbi:unnamed protein product [Phytophthora fragariaefolia]|uniref:Unnamed protein product n=1 Tax=Phytophthora fragariaefolia TaxID=1490495 RepID=A0A9W6XXN1_9STRA|nr:unnamed protein product [Phytophthora fragariaefolia]
MSPNTEDITTKDCSILHSTARKTTQTASGPAARSSIRTLVKKPVIRGNTTYRIAGNRYNSKTATQEGSYLTTKKKWHVAFINDRRLTWNGADSGNFTATKVEYRVCWLNRKWNQRGYYKKTWEPLMHLLQDGFDRELNLMDRSVRCFETNFNKFCSTDPYVKHLFGAKTSGLCIFEAFIEATKLAGRPDICTRDDIAAFFEEGRREYGFDLTDGNSWKLFVVFVRQHRAAKRDFAFNRLTKKNYVIGRRRGARVMKELDLHDGLYLVGAYNHQFIGHVVVLDVTGKKRTVHENGKCKTISSMSWINFFAFIRPFEVFVNETINMTTPR